MDTPQWVIGALFGFENTLSAWWLIVAALLGFGVGQCVFVFSSPHRGFKEAVKSCVLFGLLWGATGGVLALIGMNLFANKVLGIEGFISSVLVMSMVSGVTALGALLFAVRFQNPHPHRIRRGLDGRLKI